VLAHLARGEMSICRLVEAAVAAGELVSHEVSPAQSHLFSNWNRPEDVGSRSRE
jgi:hypothetical protein